MNYYVYGGVALAGLFTPIILFEISKCALARELRKNIEKLEQKDSELKELLKIHKDKLNELKKSLYNIND